MSRSLNRPYPARGRWWTFLLLFVALFAVLMQMPARLPANFLHQLCAQQCRLANVDGAWWDGRGTLHVKSPTSGEWVNVGPLAWKFAGPFADNHAGSFAFKVSLTGGNAVATAGWAGLTLSLDGLSMPAELLLAQKQFNLPAAGWQGMLVLRKTALAWGSRQPITAAGELAWEGAATSLLEDQPLGDLRLQWSWGAHDGLNGKLSGGRSGVLNVDGQLQLATDNATRSFEGLVVLEAAARGRLEKYLRLVAQPVVEGEGKYRLAFHSR